MFALRDRWWSTQRHSLDRSRRNCSRPRLEILEDRTLLTAGDLDPTFGVGGKVLTDFTGPVSALGSRAAIQTDGKIVVAGYSGAHFLHTPGPEASRQRPPAQVRSLSTDSAAVTATGTTFRAA